MTKRIIRIAVAVGAGVLVTTLVVMRPGSADTPECWVDVFNDFAPEAQGNAVARAALPQTASDAVEAGRRDIEADDAQSHRNRDSGDVSADPEVFAARRALYANARPGATGPQGFLEWGWDEDGRVKGVLMLEQEQEGWRILEEHFLVSEGSCSA